MESNIRICSFKNSKSVLKKVDFEVFLLNLALFIVENGTFLMKIIDFSIRASPLFNSTLHDGNCLALF